MAKRSVSSRKERFWPYAYEAFGLELQPKRCVLDGSRSVSAANVARHLIDLSEYRFDSVAIECLVDVPGAVVAQVVPEAEREEPHTEVLIAVRCAKTHTRTSVTADPAATGGGQYSAVVTLRRVDIMGSVELVPYLLRTKAIPSQPGYATDRGAQLASSRAWEVRFDRLREGTGAYLDIRYASFRAGTPSHLRPPEK